VADFSYNELTLSDVVSLPGEPFAPDIETPVIEDVKMQSGHRTEVYKIKKALMEAMGHTIEEY